MPHDPHERFMAEALALAQKGHAEGGCPIGALLVDDTGRILGKGHNALVQEGNPIVHGEMAALRDAGRLPNRHATTMYTTLQPCFMCTGAIMQLGIPRVVIGDATNASSDDTIRVLRSRGGTRLRVEHDHLHAAAVSISRRVSDANARSSGSKTGAAVGTRTSRGPVARSCGPRYRCCR